MGKLIVFGTFGFTGFLCVLNIILIIAYSWTYNVLTQEDPIAIIKFQKLDKNNISQQNIPYTVAILEDSNNDKIGEYKIYGEQWRLDAKFMKMKYWANLLGLDSRYSLERIEGRYKKSIDQNTKKNISYNLGEDTIIDSFSILGWNPFVDIEYGSSTYQDINLNYQFIILKTTTGIIVRKEEIPKTVNEESFTSSIINKTKKLFE